ncbi:MAG TPA: RT0821/Lpp0805 family surface protein [Dongiaceae bacterium]|nr:RT0821/Lpp0805 family surface protein [Dongiaceae bacterium]
MFTKAKTPVRTMAGILLMLAAGAGNALAGTLEIDELQGSAAAAASASLIQNRRGDAPQHRQIAVDDRWHGHGYGSYPYPGPYYRPYPGPVVVAPTPAVIVPAPVVVAPAPVYAYPAPVVVPAPVPVANQVVCRGSNNGAILGGAIGGATGAAIGATAAHHHSWEAATGGAILGILLGSAVGHAVDAGDQYCTTQAVIAAPVGRPVYWTNPTYGRQYQVVPLRQYRAWGTTCRDYQASALVSGRWQQIHGTTCLQPDGSWQQVSG